MVSYESFNSITINPNLHTHTSSCTVVVLFYSCMFGSSEVASGRARACMFWMSDYYANYYT